MSIKDTARAFFHACETGKGWEECRRYCTPDASFASQTDMFGGMTSLAEYTESMAHLATPMPDMRYEMIAFGVDEEREAICAAATFHATHTGEGGPVPPTGKAVASEYCYVIRFKGDKVGHMTKIWNDNYALRQAGWA